MRPGSRDAGAPHGRARHPMDEHESMIEAVDAVSHERFMQEIESDPRVREEWEWFLFTSHDDEADDF